LGHFVALLDFEHIPGRPSLPRVGAVELDASWGDENRRAPAQVCTVECGSGTVQSMKYR
jgi:hypothetical protein